MVVALSLAAASLFVSSKVVSWERLSSISVRMTVATTMLIVVDSLRVFSLRPDGLVAESCLTIAILIAGCFTAAISVWGDESLTASGHLIGAGLCSLLAFVSTSQSAALDFTLMIASLCLTVAHLTLAFGGNRGVPLGETLTGASTCALTVVALYGEANSYLIVTGIALTVSCAAAYERAIAHRDSLRPPCDE
jgi:hypothetical protein